MRPYPTRLRQRAGADRLRALYPASTDADVARELGALYSDWGMTCPLRRDARAFAATGEPVFMYRFMHAPDVLGRSQGAFHGSELAYLFPSVFATKGLKIDDDDRALQRIMIGIWARFASTGDPNGGELPRWPRYDARHDAHLTIDLAPAVAAGLRRTECDAWDAIAL